jgi:hypothetical protein
LQKSVFFHFWRAGFCITIQASSRFPFYPDEGSGCSLQSGLGGKAYLNIIGWVSMQQTTDHKPGSSGHPDFFYRDKADNGAAAP